jgi:hypothetical protein
LQRFGAYVILDFIRFFSGPFGLSTAAVLIFLAGLSDGVGTRTSVLLLNRIAPAAFVLSLLVSALLFLLSAAIWIWGVWLAATQLFGLENALPDFFYGISVAYTPFLFSALALLPLVGPLLRSLLRLWSFAIGFGVLLSLGLAPWQAILSAVAGALLVNLASWVLSEPATALWRRIWAVVVRSPYPSANNSLPRVIPGYAPTDEIAP